MYNGASSANMAALQNYCKVCGALLPVIQGETIIQCKYCGVKQTTPAAVEAAFAAKFQQAAQLLQQCEFDRAEAVYDDILAENPLSSEAHWCLVLSRYGIEYVEELSGKRVPTCHRLSYIALTDDENYQNALSCCENQARKDFLLQEGARLEALRAQVAAVAATAKPYDIFISYKETGENGERTEDRLLAQHLFDQLQKNGYRVFYSRISLKEMAGSQYEPIIYSALSTAKMMLVVGTSPEHMGALWVKNEWMRFLQMIQSGQSKVLLPCIKGFHALQMPQELRHLPAQSMETAQDMQKLLSIVDQHVLDSLRMQKSKATPRYTLLEERGFLALEEHQWDSAAYCFHQLMDIAKDSVPARLGLMMAHRKLESLEEVKARCMKDDLLRDPTMAAARKIARREWLQWFMELENNEISSFSQNIIAIQQAARHSAWTILNNGIGISLYGRILYCDNDRVPEEWAEAAAALSTREGYLILTRSGKLHFEGNKDILAKDISELYLCTDSAFYVKQEDGSFAVLPRPSRQVSRSVFLDRRATFAKWKDIIQVIFLGDQIVGLTKSGALYIEKEREQTRLQLSGWRNLLNIDVICGADSHDTVIGLMANGKLIYSGSLPEWAQAVTKEENVAFLFAPDRVTIVGWHADGSSFIYTRGHSGKRIIIPSRMQFDMNRQLSRQGIILQPIQEAQPQPERNVRRISAIEKSPEELERERILQNRKPDIDVCTQEIQKLKQRIKHLTLQYQSLGKIAVIQRFKVQRALADATHILEEQEKKLEVLQSI